MPESTSPTTAAPRVRTFFMSFGMGAESSAWVHRVLTDPSVRPPEILPDYSNLIIAVAQTGDEWLETGQLVVEHILPLIRRHNVRFVEVARKGPAKADGVIVLQDTRQPYRLHLDGAYKLSKENRQSGTMPILSGHHSCAQKSKGEPLDWWRAQEFGDEPYLHAIGYNRDETSRIAVDQGYKMGGRRHAVYPIQEWDWTRDDCVAYLAEAIVGDNGKPLGIQWPKSCCRQCPFISVMGWPEQRQRFIDNPREAVEHVIDEYVTLALNPRSGLYGPGRSLLGRLQRDAVTKPIALAVEEMTSSPWAIYRVRRRYNAPAIAPRSIQKLITADRTTVRAALAEIAHLSHLRLHRGEPIPGAPKKNGEVDSFERLWINRRTRDAYPDPEEFHVAAPAQADDKALSTFEKNWGPLLNDSHRLRAQHVGTAVTAVAAGLGDTRKRDIFGVLDLAS